MWKHTNCEGLGLKWWWCNSLGAPGVLSGSQRKGRRKILTVKLPIPLGSFFKETGRFYLIYNLRFSSQNSFKVKIRDGLREDTERDR